MHFLVAITTFFTALNKTLKVALANSKEFGANLVKKNARFSVRH